MQSGAMTRTDYDVEANQCYDNNNYCALNEILFLHYKKPKTSWVGLFLLFLVYSCNGRPGNLKNGFVSAPYKKT